MDAFTALADPTRRQIVEVLAAGDRSFGDLAGRFEMSRPAVSQHLRVLRDVGLVAARPDRQRRIYRLNDNALDELQDWLDAVRAYWNPRLDALEYALAGADSDNHEEQGNE